MASATSSDCKNTRLQVETLKRSADERLKEQAELKRKKRMFAPRKVIGPRDLIVNSNVPKIKLEEDVGCSSVSKVKQENLDLEPSLEKKTGENYELIDPCDNIANFENNVLASELNENASESLREPYEQIEEFDGLVLEPNVAQNRALNSSEIIQSDNLSENSSFESADSQFLHQHIMSLKVLLSQKDNEINQLNELIRGLQVRCSRLDANVVNQEKQHVDQAPSNIHKDPRTFALTKDKTTAVAHSTAVLTSKNIQIELLTIKMIKLQKELFVKMNNDSQILKDCQASQQTKLEKFDKVLPFLYPVIDLNDILACRKVCHNWQISVDTFLSNQPSPFNKDAELADLRKGFIPTWMTSPLNTLAKAYTFSDWHKFKTFTNRRKGKLIGSSVCLNNVLFSNVKGKQDNFERFLRTFGAHIKHLKIRQFVPLVSCKFDELQGHVNLCLRCLPNLTSLTVVICIGGDDSKTCNIENASEDMVKAKVFNVKKFEGLNFFGNLTESCGIGSTQTNSTLVNLRYQLGELRTLTLGKFITRVFIYQI